MGEDLHISPSQRDQRQVPEYLRTIWPWSIVWRQQLGEPVSRREAREVADYFKRQSEERTQYILNREAEKRREAELLEKLKPPKALVAEILRLSRARSDLEGEFTRSMSNLVFRRYSTPAEREAYISEADERAALEELSFGLGVALRAAASLRGASAARLNGSYREFAARFVRRVEREGWWRQSIILSRQAALVCWRPWFHVEWLFMATKDQLGKLAPRKGRPESADWKRQIALEAAALVYEARLKSGLNAPLPSERDGSNQAVEVLLAHALSHLECILSAGTVKSYSDKALTLLRRLCKDGWDSDSLSDPDMETVDLAWLPSCCCPAGYPGDINIDELECLSDPRRKRWIELSHLFEMRTGLSPPRKR